MASTDSSKATSTLTDEATENTPLLNNSQTNKDTESKWPKSVVYKVLFTSFLVSLAFATTQVPITYVLMLMTCDEYYKTHPDPGPVPERCKVPAIQAGTAEALALIGFSTTFFSVFNLFVTGWIIKAFGIKKAILVSTSWPCIRLLVQNVAVYIGAGQGALMMQLSQIMNIIGGPAGYLLALNAYATEIVESADRTAMLGRLQGCSMFGPAVGMLAGGLLGEINIRTPFEVTLLLFLISSLYVFFALPEITTNDEVKAKTSKSFSAFLDPIKMFTPRKWVMKSGKVKREYGILLLGIGVSLGVLATSYVPTLLQLYGTDVFDFTTFENGWVISLNCFVRGMFLTFAFPWIISAGRKWMDGEKPAKTVKIAPPQQQAQEQEAETLEESVIPIEPEQVEVPNEATISQPEPVEAAKAVDKKEAFTFDLFFTRYSLILDGLLTGIGTFVTDGWQMYVLAAVLPLGSGTGSSAKGVILQMCSPEEKTDALSAISLVEMAARMATTGVFGFVFAAFASAGKLHLVYAVNAGMAVVGFIVLLFARFVPDGSRRYVESEDDDDESAP